jgi:glycosyltransferase involved in cell wall biosynthesis
MSAILQRLKNLTRLNRRRIETTLLRVHKVPLLMLLVNLFFLTINFFVRLAMGFNRLLEKIGLRVNEHQKSDEQSIPLPESMSARVIDDSPSVLLVIEESIPQCFRYRVQQKLEQLEYLERKTEWVSWREHSKAWEKIHLYDVIIFYRVPGFPDVLRLMQYAKQLNKLMIYDLDDLIFDEQRLAEKFKGSTGQLPGYEHKAMLEGAKLYRAALQCCDYAIASTPTLADEMQKVVAKGVCELLPNALDNGLLDHYHLPRPPQSDQFIDIFYGSGTRTHDEDFALVAPVLKRVLEENSQARLVIVGHLTIPAELDSVKQRIVSLPIMSFDSFLTVLSQAKIAIAPLEPGIFADCKSEIKWIEAALFGIPCVVTPTRTYRDVIEDGVDGILAGDDREWYEALTRLVTDNSFRDSVGTAACNKVLERYGTEAMSRRLENIIDGFIEQSVNDGKLRRANAAKKSLLLVNTVYPPFAIGGATVVMKNIIDELQRRYAENYEVTVFTCDGENPQPYQLREYEYDDVNVTALSVPASPTMEWNYQDEEVERVFKAYLESRHPDLVHFHSMQRLTASPLHATEEYEIPYVVTVHDAWWLSDHQFLIDQDGNAVDELQRNPLIAAQTSVDIVSSLERTDYLARGLNSARRILAVSDYQADLYRRNGFANVEVNKNGVGLPETTVHAPAAEKTSQAGLQLAYLGGVCRHKGYYFLKSVYSRSRLANLHLRIVDFDTATKHTEQWGDNSVEFVPPFDMENMAGFYSNIDVIVAPSIWPESFGLISREALLMGKWVVAADAGGLAEDVTEGVDGHVFPLGDSDRLHEILVSLDEHADNYRLSPEPANSKPVKSIAEQVDELVALYERLVDGRGHV